MRVEREVWRETEIREHSRIKRWHKPRFEGKKEHGVLERHIRGSGRILEQFIEDIIKN